MDEYVKMILRKWELPDLIPTFENEEVNEKAFKCLTDDIIRELIPKLGKRAIFNSAYRAFREALDKQTEAVTPSDPACSSENEIKPVIEIKSELAIVDLPENDPLGDEQQMSQNDKFKFEIQAPEKVPTRNIQDRGHEQLKNMDSSSVNDADSGTLNCHMEMHTMSDISGMGSTCKERDQVLVNDNLGTASINECRTEAVANMETKKPDTEGLNIVATVTSSNSENRLSHEENVETNVETTYALNTTSNQVETATALPTNEISVLSDHNLEDPELLNESESLVVDQYTDDAQLPHASYISALNAAEIITASPTNDTDDVDNSESVNKSESLVTDQRTNSEQHSHISFCISALSEPSEADYERAEGLRQLLSTSKTLAHLLSKSFLTRSTRTLLAEEIVDHLCEANEGVLSSELLRSWARAVEMVFSQEINQLYFRESEDGHSCGGKLVQCYQRRKDTSDDRESG